MGGSLTWIYLWSGYHSAGEIATKNLSDHTDLWNAACHGKKSTDIIVPGSRAADGTPLAQMRNSPAALSPGDPESMPWVPAHPNRGHANSRGRGIQPRRQADAK